MKTQILALVKGQKALPKAFECELALEQKAAQQAKRAAEEAKQKRREQAAFNREMELALGDLFAQANAKAEEEKAAAAEAKKAKAEKRAQAQALKEKAEAEIAKRRNEFRRLKAELEARTKAEKEKAIAAAKEARAKAEQERRQRQRDQHQRDQAKAQQCLGAKLLRWLFPAPAPASLPLGAPARQVMALGVDLRDNNIDHAIKLCNAAPSAALPKGQNPWTRRVKARVGVFMFEAEHREKANEYQGYLGLKGYERDVRIAAEAKIKGGFELTFIERQNLAKGKALEVRLSVIGRLKEELADLPVREVESFEEAYALLTTKPWAVALLGKFAIFHTTENRIKDDRFQRVVGFMSQEGYTVVTCQMDEWRKLGVRTIADAAAVYLSKEGVSLSSFEGAIALGEKEELAEKLLEESGFNADGWKNDTSTAIFRMAKSALNFVFDAYAVHEFNRKKKVIKGVTKLFRCMNYRPEIMTAVPGASFSLYPIGGSFGGEEFFIDVTKHEVWGYPIFHPRKNPDCMTEWEVIVSGVFETSWNDDAGMWELTPCEAPKDFDAFSKVRTFSLPGVEQLYAALPESSIVEFVPHKEFAVVEGENGHAIIDIDVDGTEGHINPDCITAASFEQAIEMAKGALVELQAINPAWKENAIVQTGGGIRVYGPVMSPMDLMDEEKEVIERVCDPFYTESLYRSNRWSFRCTPKIVNDDFRAETMEIIETTPAKQSFVEKLKNFFAKTFEAGLSAFRNTVSYSYDFASTGYVEKTFCEKVYDGNFPSGWGYSLSVNRIENFLTFSTHQLLQCYENAKANKLWFWYCEGIGSIDPMVYGQLLADRQIVVIEEFEKSELEFWLNDMDKKYEPLDGFIGGYLTSFETMSEEMRKEMEEAITKMATLLVYPDFSKQEEIQVKNKKTWISLSGGYTNETPCFGTSDFVDKYLVHEEDTDEVLRRLVAGERFITCNPSQWKALGYSWANIPGQFKAFLNREGLNLADIKRIAIQGKKKLSFYVETAEGWYEILYKSGKGWAYGSSEPLTGNKVTYFGNGADSFQTAEIKFPVFCSMEIPARPTTSNVGDVFVADEFAKVMYLIGANKFNHEAVAGFALVDNGYELVYKKMAVFHGSDKVDGHAHQEWFLPLVQEVDLVLCCNWAIALPSDQQHKAIPMWHSRITNSNQGKILKTKAICGTHSILAVTDNKGDDVNRVEWLQLIDGEPSFGTKKLGKKYGVFQMRTFSDRLKKGRVGEAIAIEYFEQHGWKVKDIASNPFLFSMGVDLILSKGDQIIYIDVKTASKDFKGKLHIISSKGKAPAPIYTTKANYYVVVYKCGAIIVVDVLKARELLKNKYPAYETTGGYSNKIIPLKDFGDKVKILRSQTLFTVQSLKDAYKALNIGAGVVIWDNPEAKVAVGHTEAVKLATPLLKERGVEFALTCNAAETEFEPWVEIWQHRDIVLSEDGTLGVQGGGIKLGFLRKDKSIPTPRPEEGEIGDFAVTPKFAELDLELGERKSEYKVLTGNCAVKTKDGWVIKKLASFHGDITMPKDEFFHKLVDAAEVILCCNWGLMLPAEHQHKAVPMIWLSLTDNAMDLAGHPNNKRPHAIYAEFVPEEGSEVAFLAWAHVWKEAGPNGEGVLAIQNSRSETPEGVIVHKEEKVLDHLSLSSGDSAKSPEDNQKEVQMVETKRVALIDAARKVCRRQKDGTISMKYKGSKFVALFNEIVGSEEVRPIVPGFEATPNDNMQGLALPMVAYEGHVGVTNGTFPAFKVEDGQFVPGHYSRAGFAWKGVANFGIYGGETENEHARHPSILRIQYPTQFEQGKDIRIVFCDFANPGIVARLFEVNAVRLPKNGTQAEMEKFIKGLISGLGTKIDPAIDGTIWVSTLGVPFAPKMPKGQTQSTYQYRGTCVFPQEVGDAVAANNADYASLWEQVFAEIGGQIDKSKAGWVAALQASTNPVIVKWREGIADLASYLMMDILTIEQVVQIICGDLAIKENVAIHSEYFKQSKHYGAYLKGLVATQPWLAPGVVLMDINAVKDISKKPLKVDLKANNGVVEAQAGHKYVIGMMQDYSKGGIRVGSQPNTYVRSHKDGVLTVEESVERFVDFVENTVLTELGKGLQVQEVLDQLKKSMNFTNSGDGDMEGQFLVEQIVDAASGFVPAFWNHEAGRRVIRNTIKTLMNRYSFGFMTKAMKRIGTFVSVKSYITDLNLLPAAYQNGDSDDLSLFVEFTGGDDKSALGKLPITVVLFKNASFWKALGKDHTLGGILRYPVSNKDMFSGVWIVSPEAIVRDADIARLCGFEGFSTTLVENYLRGLAEGYYANSVTVKYLLCGDSDGDTAGTIPMDVDFTVDASSRTLSATINNGDALFFWAITETRDLVQRKFAELEGFTHLQGKRKINPAAVEHVLGESNIAVGNCALWQQAVKGILDTYDKGLFRAEARLRRRNSRLYNKEEQAWESFTPAQAMDAWTWYVERILIPSYRILPCSLELAIMSQKKDLFEAFKAVTAMLVSNDFVVDYGPADARRTMVLWDKEGSAPAIFTEKIFSELNEMVEKAEWAMLMGSLTQAVMKHLGIGVRQEDGSVVEVTWVAATRTSAMAEKENPETLLANQTDAAWGILDSDGLSWTNSYWVGYLRPHFERIRDKVEAMLHSEATFSKDKQLNLSWNRSYSRGSFNRYNLPNYTTDNNGVIVEDKEAFFEQVRAWYASKITSRLFGMNLHGWTRFSMAVGNSKFTKEDREQSAPHYANPKVGAMSLMIVWAYFQKVASANPGVFSNESEFKKFFLKLDDMCEDNHNTKLFLNWIVEVLWDADACSEYKEHIFAFAKKHKLPSHANPQKQAWIIYCATLQGDVRVCEYLWAVDKAKQFLGVSPSFDEVRPMFVYFGSYNFINFNDEGKVVVASEKYKYFVSIWKEAQRRHGKALATEYRKSVKDNIGAIVSGWGEKEYASLFALAHQETFQAHANLCRKYDEAHFAKISNELTGQWAATYKANFLTEYASELVFRLDTPTTIAGFLRVDRFIFEVVSTEMEAKRICFESTEFQFSVVDLGIKQGPLTVRPVYRKTANSEVHGLELLQDNTLVGFIGADPTSRVLLYFKSDEMFVNSIVTNLNKEDTKAVYGIKQARAGGSCYLVQAPHSAKDQQEMLNRFLGAFADEVQDAKFGIVSVKAEMKSPELLLEKTHAEVNKRLAKVNKDSNQKNPRRCDMDVAIERTFKTPIKPAMELTKDHEWLVAMMVSCAINNKQLDSEIEMLGNFEIVLGTETYRLQDGIYTVESEIEYEEETVDSMTFDQEPEVSVNPGDYAHYDVYIPEEEEEVWYPEEFEVIEAVEEAATETVEEVIEAEEVTEVIAEEVIEEAVEEVIEQEEPEVVIEQAPVVIKAPVAVIESDDEDEKILEQITGLISKLSPKVRKAFDKGLESGKKALEKEKAKLESKKIKLQAELTVVNKELAEINTALEASNDDDGGDDDGGGNGGGTPAPADNSPAPASAPPAPPIAFESRIFEVNGERYEIPENFQGLEVLIGENKHSLHQGRSAAKLLNPARKIQIDPVGVEELWVKQYYVSPRVEGVYGLEADAFDSVQEMVMFLLWHEYFHTVIGRAPKDNKSEYARIENECNFAAAKELGIFKRAYPSLQGKVLVVTGGREFADEKYIQDSLEEVLAQIQVSLFIHGDARGVDRIAGSFVESKGIPVKVMPADWSQGKGAGFKRNEEMAKLADVCVVFPGGNGTAHMKGVCEKLGLEILDYGQKPTPQKTQEVISEFRGENFFLSNFANARIEHKGVVYKSVEHFYQAMKFTDPNIRARVAGAPNGADAKKIAKQNKQHIREDWEKIKDDVMWYGIQCKFRGNENHKESLRNTGDAHITHLNTWGDVYWGVSFEKGEDKLGKMLMKVRDEINQ